MLKLVRRFLTAGIMVGGLQESSTEGTPQGGPLSPLLSNIVLDELDKELEKRRLRFVRYADDFIVFVRSKRAAERVMKSVSQFITRSLPNFRSLHYWILRRLRAILWKHWKNPRTRIRELKKRQIPHYHALLTGCARKGPWRMSRVKWVMVAFPKSCFLSLGLFLPGLDRARPDRSNRRMRDPHVRWCGRG